MTAARAQRSGMWGIAPTSRASLCRQYCESPPPFVRVGVPVEYCPACFSRKVKVTGTSVNDTNTLSTACARRAAERGRWRPTVIRPATPTRNRPSPASVYSAHDQSRKLPHAASPQSRQPACIGPCPVKLPAKATRRNRRIHVGRLSVGARCRRPSLKQARRYQCQHCSFDGRALIPRHCSRQSH